MTSERAHARSAPKAERPEAAWVGAALLVAAGLSGCAEDPTEVVVVVESDFRVPGDADTVEFRLGDDAVMEEMPRASVNLAETPFPLTWVITSDGASDSVAVVVTALRGDELTLSHTAMVEFSAERTVKKAIKLARVCIAIPCSPGETCRESTLGTPECTSIFDDARPAADRPELEGTSP